MMRAKTKKQLCANVAERWDRQYERLYDKQPDKLVIYDKLKALDGQGTEAQIAEIIGYPNWTHNHCMECGKDAQTTIHLGDEPDYDACWVFVCLKCLRAAAQMAVHEAVKRRDEQQTKTPDQPLSKEDQSQRDKRIRRDPMLGMGRQRHK